MSSARRWNVSPESVRSHVADVNDGILAVAGFSEGLVATGMSSTAVLSILSLSALAGSVAVAGVRLGEEAADREVQQALAAAERRLIELSPAEELAELVHHFEAKGVTPETARKVAEELSAADALSAQLETEYGIRELTPPGQPWRQALGSGLSFLLGALVPILIAYITPGPGLDGLTVVAVTTSLLVTSIILARLGGTRVWPTLARSLLVGLAALGASYLGSHLLF